MRKMRRQAGFTLLELVLVIGVIAIMAMSELQDKTIDFEQMQGRKLGLELFRYNHAVQRAIAAKSSDPSFAGTYTGVDWLKASTCGGPATNTVGMLPCSFLNHTGGTTSVGRLSFTTEITYSAQDGMTAKTTMSTYQKNGVVMGDISGLAALVAAGAYIVKDEASPPINEDGTVVFCLETPSPAVASLCGPAKNQIVMYARNLAPGNNWLRVDHGNLMGHTIEFGTAGDLPTSDSDLSLVDSTMRQIRNVARIYNVDDVSGSNALILGNRLGQAARTTAQLLNDSVIVDADQEILGELRVQANITSEGDVFVNDTNGDGVGGNITAKNNITTSDGDFIAKDTNADGNGGNATIQKNITSTEGNVNALDGDIIATDTNKDGLGGNLEAEKDIVSYNGNISAEDGNLYVEDANGDGVGGDMFVRGDGEIDGYLNVGKYLEVDEDARIHGNLFVDKESQLKGKLYAYEDSWFQKNIYVNENAYVTKDVVADRFVDDDDSNFYVDPNGDSKFNNIFVENRIVGSGTGGLSIDSNMINLRDKNGTKNSSNAVNLNGFVNGDDFRIKDRDGKYRAINTFFSRYVMVEAHAVAHGGSVPKPSCQDGGTPKIFLITHQALVSGQTPEQNGFPNMKADWYSQAIDNGSVWGVEIGNGMGGKGGFGVAQVYCYYG